MHIEKIQQNCFFPSHVRNNQSIAIAVATTPTERTERKKGSNDVHALNIHMRL